jgi:hypothetical protein
MPTGNIQQTFILSHDTHHVLGIPVGCDRTYGEELNSNRVTAGGCNDLATGTWRGVVWFGTTPRVLNAMINPALGYYVRSALDVSDGGLVVAEVYAANGLNISLVLAPVPRLLGDANCDGRVNVNDLLKVINHWGACSYCDADLNLDGVVNAHDLLLVILNWFP